jgi:hypothetical protein
MMLLEEVLGSKKEEIAGIWELWAKLGQTVK